MKTIWVVQYNDGTANVFDEDQGPPSWPYVDAFEAKQRIAELEEELREEAQRNTRGAKREATYVIQIADLNKRNWDLMGAMREWYEDGFDRGGCGELIVKHGGDV